MGDLQASATAPVQNVMSSIMEEDQKLNASSIMEEAEHASRALEDKLAHQQSAQAAALERRTTEARRKREEDLVKSNITTKLSGEKPKISPAQARAQQAMVKKLFQAIDTDGDGALGSTEVKALCVGSGVEFNGRRASGVDGRIRDRAERWRDLGVVRRFLQMVLRERQTLIVDNSYNNSKPILLRQKPLRNYRRVRSVATRILEGCSIIHTLTY